MILDSINNSEKYFPLHKHFAKAFEFLKQDNLSQLPDGKYEILEEEIFCIISRNQPGKKKKTTMLEAHRKYIDIQFVISGPELMGWKPISDFLLNLGDYDQDKDIIFFREVPSLWLKVPEKSFAIFFPEDTHAPLVSDGYIHKAIIKIAI